MIRGRWLSETYPSERNAHVATPTAYVNDLALTDLFPGEALFETVEVPLDYSTVSTFST
jgi:hypothetical protein